ncbi:MAG: hypothetical protein Q9166_005146 [cf. Caloplaca sp. 2 TL-2023]
MYTDTWSEAYNALNSSGILDDLETLDNALASTNDTSLDMTSDENTKFIVSRMQELQYALDDWYYDQLDNENSTTPYGNGTFGTDLDAPYSNSTNTTIDATES